jgi:hypothetical protein
MKSAHEKALLLSFDLLGFNSQIAETLRARIRQITGFEDRQIILACTHTHSAPPTIELTKTGKINPVYVRLLAERTSSAVKEALSRSFEASCRYTAFRLPEVSVNRRDPSRTTNHVLSLLQFQAHGRTLAAVIHYSAHPNAVCEDRISADYPGYLCRRIEEELGVPFALFVLGAAGDANPQIDRFSYDEMQRVGQFIFESIRTNLDRGEWIGTEALRLEAGELPVRHQAYTSLRRLTRKINDINDFMVHYIRRGPRRRLQRNPVYRTICQILDRKDLSGADSQVVRFVALALLENNQRYLSALSKDSRASGKVRVQFLALGEIVFVFVGAELFSSSALELQRRFPQRKIVLCGCLDPLVGYIPPAEEYEKGGYEIEEAFLFFGADIPLARDTEERLLAYLSDRLEAFFHSGALPGGEQPEESAVRTWRRAYE